MMNPRKKMESKRHAEYSAFFIVSGILLLVLTPIASIIFGKSALTSVLIFIIGAMMMSFCIVKAYIHNKRSEEAWDEYWNS